MLQYVYNNCIELKFTLSLILVLFALYYVKNIFKKHPQKPPRIKYSLPFLGHLIYVKYKTNEKFFEWSHVYGNVFEVILGNQNAIVINSCNYIRDAIVKNQELFANRPKLYMLEKTLKGLGIVSSQYTKSCIENRNLVHQFLHKTLKMKSEYLEPYINNYVQILLEGLNEKKEILTDELKLNINYILAQRILMLLYGYDCDNKELLINLLKKIDDNFNKSSVVSAFNFLPITRIFQTLIFKNVNIVKEFLEELTLQKLNEHQDNNSDTFVDTYIENIKINKDLYNIDQLISLVQDLFLSSTETLATTIIWALIYVSYYENYQKIIHDEIDKFIEEEKKISYDNAKLKAPFTFAFLYETLRYICSGPIIIPRSNSEDLYFHDYFIPQHSMVLINMWSCTRDPTYWKNPNNFFPYRFIDENGQFKSCNPAMLVFSAGKRYFLGEELAKTELFLVFTNILQKMRLTIVDKPDNPDKIMNYGINICPKNILLKYDFR